MAASFHGATPGGFRPPRGRTGTIRSSAAGSSDLNRLPKSKDQPHQNRSKSQFVIATYQSRLGQGVQYICELLADRRKSFPRGMQLILSPTLVISGWQCPAQINVRDVAKLLQRNQIAEHGIEIVNQFAHQLSSYPKIPKVLFAKTRLQPGPWKRPPAPEAASVRDGVVITMNQLPSACKSDPWPTAFARMRS
jgi:hypothetical protein